jgi:S-DNA-T family DNA segregation ATPase FtsK/SpoIIIE
VLRTKKNKPAIKHRYAEVWGLLLFGAAVFLGLSLFDYDPQRNPLLTTNYGAIEGGYTGPIGTVAAYGLYLVFGLGAVVIPVFMFLAGVLFVIRKPPRAILVKAGYVFIVAASLSCIAELQQSLDLREAFPFLKGMPLGGALGERLGNGVLRSYLGPGGGAVVAVTGFVVGTMLLTRVQFYPYARLMARASGKTGVFLVKQSSRVAKVVGRGAKALFRRIPRWRPKAKEEEETKALRQKKPAPATVAAEGVSRPMPVKEKKPAPAAMGEYQLPSIELLNLPPSPPKRALAEDLKKNAEVLEKTFRDFGIEATIGEIQRGPVITRYEVHPAPGVKVTRISSLADEIALAMRVAGIRVTPPIPGKGAIGVEIPNTKPALVVIREVLSSEEFRDARGTIPLGIGKSVAGTVVVGDLTEMPHLLIAGATGSGKSVCINAILVTLLYRLRPDELKLLIIDPKKIELGSYNGLPHLLIPVVTEAKKVALALNWLVAEMERRYDYLSKAGVRNIAAYNARPIDRSKKSAEEELPDRLSYIVTVIDELADLMMITPVDVEMAIMRLAQLSRSVGIHLIIATQRPSVNVITGVIKANFPARISFQVATKVDSRTVIDANGAETLVGNGDLLFMPPGTSKLIRAQGTYVDDAEIERVVKFIKDQAGPAYQDGLLPKEEKAKEVEEEEEEEERITDELFDRAVEIVLRTNQASASNLQRKMKIGYARAGRIIDMMEQRGIVGPADGSKPRKILVGMPED